MVGAAVGLFNVAAGGGEIEQLARFAQPQGLAVFGIAEGDVQRGDMLNIKPQLGGERTVPSRERR